MNPQNQLKEFFVDFFSPIDNIPEDTVRREQICMEARASLLIEANCTSERFPAFMKSGRRENSGWVYRFPQAFVRQLPHSFGGLNTYTLTWTFAEFEIGGEQFFIDTFGNSVDRWRLWLIPDPSAQLGKNLKQQSGLQGNYTADQVNNELLNDFKQIEQNFQQTYRSRFQLCSQISPYKTPEQVCRFFGNRGEVFAKLRSSSMHPDCFPENSVQAVQRRDDQANWSDVCVEQEMFQQIFPCSLQGSWQPQLSGKYYDNWFCQVFPFRNEYGEIRMQLIKLYDPETQTKCLIPVTTWMRGNYPYNQYFCVPLPEDKQPLYNLDLLLKPETETVILTDSVELADSNQRNAPDSVVFTSFICSPEHYEQVNWSPLREKEVWYLVANHSGISLEAAYLKAKELADFLLETEEISLKYIQLKVEYPSLRYFESVDSLLDCYRNREPEVKAESLLLLENDTDFDIQYQKALEFIHSKPVEWWEGAKKAQSEEQRIITRETNKRPRPAYLLRPFLLRGEASMLYASKSTGKSVLALSMAAAVVSGKPLFPEKWWTVPEPQHYPLNKVLYLDFENGKDEIEQRLIDFAYPYWPQDKADREKCNANLIIRDMTASAGKDYSQPENWQEVLDMLEYAKSQGIAGQPVDLLVIDTLTKFTRKPYTTTLNLSDFVNRLRTLNLAILLVHHEGNNGEVRGWKCGLDDVYFNLRLYREMDKEEKDASPIGRFTVKDLEEPLILAYHNARSSIEKIPAFEVRFDQKWQEYYREDDPDSGKSSEERRREEFKRIVKHYLDKRLENQDIFPLLGISKDTYYKLKK
ncbi:AAA family ATPase [bacterium]|nr:AAA family ATPase [bacterium]